VGDEQSDYTVKCAGATPVDYTYYYYGATKSRAGATVNTALVLSQTQKTRPPGGNRRPDANTKSVTYYAVMSGMSSPTTP